MLRAKKCQLSFELCSPHYFLLSDLLKNFCCVIVTSCPGVVAVSCHVILVSKIVLLLFSYVEKVKRVSKWCGHIGTMKLPLVT